MNQPPPSPSDRQSHPGPWTDLVVHNVPAAVIAIYRPRVSLLGVVLVAWVGVGVGLVIRGHQPLGVGVLVLSLAVFVMLVTTLRAWLSRNRGRPVLVIRGTGIELSNPPLHVPWHTIEAVEVQSGRGWLRTPAMVLQLSDGVTARTPGSARSFRERARWRRWQERGVVIDAGALDTPVHTIVEAISTASDGLVDVPTTGLR